MDRPNEENLILQIYTKKNISEGQLLRHKICKMDDLNEVNFDAKQETIVNIHGFAEEQTDDSWSKRTARSWAKHWHRNAIVVDWYISSGTSNYFKVCLLNI